MLYNPFLDYSFQPNRCFLSGEILTDETKCEVSVFPQWLMNRYHLKDTHLSMLGGNWAKYEDLKLPTSQKVATAIKGLDTVTEQAFTEGYEAVKQLQEMTIFHFMARIMYGTLYYDMQYAYEKRKAKNAEFKMSALVLRKLKNLHFMLQSLLINMQFHEFCPWSIACFPVNYSKDIFNYKDETHKLNFCLGMNGFGIVACLQDNGEIKKFHQEIINKIGNAKLHPVQFEETYGRFIYANYLLRENPDYIIDESEEGVVFHLPEIENSEYAKYPKYAAWDDNIFAQVLANMWQPWGIQMKEIHDFPNAPLSYLIDEHNYEFINPATIKLPF